MAGTLVIKGLITIYLWILVFLMESRQFSTGKYDVKLRYFTQLELNIRISWDILPN